MERFGLVLATHGRAAARDETDCACNLRATILLSSARAIAWRRDGVQPDRIVDPRPLANWRNVPWPSDASAGIDAQMRKGRDATIRPAVVKKRLDRAGKSDQNKSDRRWLIAP
jgi:hypothetical protein